MRLSAEMTVLPTIRENMYLVGASEKDHRLRAGERKYDIPGYINALIIKRKSFYSLTYLDPQFPWDSRVNEPE